MVVGRRTGRFPEPGDTLIVRILAALDVSPQELAKSLKLREPDIYKLHGPAGLTADVDRDETWWRVMELVDEQIGHILAVRHDLDMFMTSARTRRVARHARHLQRSKRRREP